MGRYADSVTAILLEQGRAKAQGQLGSGQAWGHFADQMGQIPGQIAALREQQATQAQEKQLREQQIKANEALTAQRQQQLEQQKSAQQIHDEAEAAYQQIKKGNVDAILGPMRPESRSIAEGWLNDFTTSTRARAAQGEDDAKKAAKMIQAFDYDPVVAATSIRLLGDLYPDAKTALDHVSDPAALKKIVDHFATLGEKPAGTREVKVRNPDGSETTQIVSDTPGQTFQSAAPPKPEPTTIDAAILAARGNGPETRQLLNLKGQMAAAGRDPSAPKDERIVQIMGPQGTPIWVRESAAVGQPAAQAARAVTGQERQTLAFYNRAKQADDTVIPLEDTIGKMSLAGQARLQMAPNFLQSPENQAYRQAQRAFTEARLRKESGAAIPIAEYENDARTYFAQPGDTPKILEQKRKARATVLDGLAFSSGRAYEEFYGEPRPGAIPKPGAAPQVEEWVRDANGKLVKKGAQ